MLRMEIALFLVLALLGAFLLPISYVETPQGSYSAGPYAVVSYAGVAFYLVLCAVLLFGNWRSLDRRSASRSARRSSSSLRSAPYRGCTTHGSSAAWA